MSDCIQGLLRLVEVNYAALECPVVAACVSIRYAQLLRRLLI